MVASPWWALLLGIVAIGTGVVTAVTLVLPYQAGGTTSAVVPQGSQPPTVTSPAGSGAAIDPSSTPVDSVPPASTTSSADSAAGRCFTRPGAQVDCAEEHRYESIGYGAACDPADAIRYVGGVLGVDVLMVDGPTRYGPDCLVRSPQPVTSSMRDVLRQGTNAVWRRCVDGDLNRVVACSSPHTGEYLGTGSTAAPTAAECAATVRDYVGVPYSSLDDVLKVQALAGVGADPGAARCLLSVRGEGVELKVILRNLGNQQVEVGPR